MIMKKLKPYLKWLTVAGIIFHGFSAHSQDMHFSQFFEAPLLRNPSLAGIYTGDIRVQAVYRDQWNSLTTAYKTASLNAEYKAPIGKADDFITAGIQVMHDRSGAVAWTSTYIMPALNYHKSLSANANRYLSLGFMAGIAQKSIDRSKLETNTTYDGGGDGEGGLAGNYSHFDGAVGMSFNSQLNEDPENNFFAGAALHHFTKPRNSFYEDGNAELPMKVVVSGGVRLSVTPASYITLQADYSRQADFNELIGGALYGIKIGPELNKPIYTLHGGVFIRMNDALIPVVKLDYHPFSVSFSYDATVSKLKTSTYGRGGFELGISYVGFLARNKRDNALNAVFCPRF
jgi:type IX secretion system PorP/SprF family membrane protein